MKTIFMLDLQSGELETGKLPEHMDTTRFYTAGGRVVFGGGGISPDVFVPLDTIIYNEDYLNLRQELSPFIFKWYEENKGSLSYNGPEDFIAGFSVSDDLFEAFLGFARENEVDTSGAKRSDIKKQLKLYLKARLGKHLFNDNTLFQVLAEKDPFIDAAINSFKNESILPIVEKN
jgi:carboxyl-terminal processing protease